MGIPIILAKLKELFIGYLPTDDRSDAYLTIKSKKAQGGLRKYHNLDHDEQLRYHDGMMER